MFLCKSIEINKADVKRNKVVLVLYLATIARGISFIGFPRSEVNTTLIWAFPVLDAIVSA